MVNNGKKKPGNYNVNPKRNERRASEWGDRQAGINPASSAALVEAAARAIVVKHGVHLADFLQILLQRPHAHLKVRAVELCSAHLVRLRNNVGDGLVLA